MNKNWEDFCSLYFENSKLGFSLDVSHFQIRDHELNGDLSKKALVAMDALVRGAEANPDEKRMVGHYWLRAPELAPNQEIRGQITETVESIASFVSDVIAGEITAEKGGKFETVLIVGIGGSALGPQFVYNALRETTDNKKLKLSFFDNTDADGMARVLAEIPALEKTLVVVISKSGGTKETRNGMLVAKHVFEKRGLNFAKAAVAVTGEGSQLDNFAKNDGWLGRFPMWEWVGGRTSELSAVGLLPAALQGVDTNQMLRGAKEMDSLTSSKEPRNNPALLLAHAWYQAGAGKGRKDMVILPYNDRLELISRYLQQLVMESLGKEKDLDGNIVHQGIAVYGNKGSTDQHAYIQQLRDGLDNFFATFIQVRSDETRSLPDLEKFEVESGVTNADYLSGFLFGTREALLQRERKSILVTVDNVSPFSIGMLIALFERAVGFYATMINVNAYHQPGVEAGKKAAEEILKLQLAILTELKRDKRPQTAQDIATKLKSERVVEIYLTLKRLSLNKKVQIAKAASSPKDEKFITI
jgi:glucose-6-phosphate isomerase